MDHDARPAPDSAALENATLAIKRIAIGRPWSDNEKRNNGRWRSPFACFTLHRTTRRASQGALQSASALAIPG
jgi:hypothetical protein